MTAKSHASPPAPFKKTFLNMAPLQLCDAICSDCGNKMSAVPLRDKQGRIDRNLVKFFCDTCHCGFEAQLIYFNGTNIRYEEPEKRNG